MADEARKERLIEELDRVRNELFDLVKKLSPEDFDWAPQTGMKTCSALLEEICTEEMLCQSWLIDRISLDWTQGAEALAWSARDAASAIAPLDRVRSATLDYLRRLTPEELLTPIPLPEWWHPWMGEVLSPDELIRWIMRHEYYHLGQLVTYRWIQGHDPYKE